MILLHVSDLHLGKSLGDFDLFEDQKFILDSIISSAQSISADAVLISGDVYDKSIPSESAVSLFDYFISRLAEIKIKTFIISGNHDSDERLNLGSSLFRANNIFISAKYDGRLMRVTLTDRFGPVNIYLLPFVRASLVRHYYPDENISNYSDAVKAAISHADIDFSERNVILAHQFVVGGTDGPLLGGSESPATQSVGLVEKVGSDCFNGFDYVALGHIHSAQQVGRKEVRYSGSPLGYSLSEAGQDKFAVAVTLGEKNDIAIEQIKLRPLRALRRLKGRLDQLLSPENLSSQDDFVFVTLTDEDVIDNAMAIFQQHYPHTVRIEYDNSHTRGISDGAELQKAEVKPFSEIFSDFYRQIYGCDMSDDEKALIEETAKEAGLL